MYINTDDQRTPLSNGAVVTIRSAESDSVRKYVIDRVTGHGGFAILYIAHEKENPHRFVALKELFPRVTDGAIAERRTDGRIVIYDPMLETNASDHYETWRELERAFTQEAEMTVQAGAVYNEAGDRVGQNNPDILRVEGPYLAENGNRYLVLDTYNGESLSDYINDGWKPFDQRGHIANHRLPHVIDVLIKVVKKLSALHGDRRMYHLDLSDANIYLSKRLGGTEPDPYIIDYGSAYNFESVTEREQIAHRFTCNPYSAPEVVALSATQSEGCGYRVDASSDLYSIAAIFFYAVLGEHYTPDMIYASGWKEQIRSFYPSAVYGNLADDLIEFFGVGLALGQIDRFRTAGQLMTALQKLAKSFEKKGLLNAIDPDELMASLILYRYPLYEYTNEAADLNILCLGSGEFVRRMILSMISVGQMPDRKLKIHVVSADAEECRADLLQRAPELANYSNLDRNTDVIDEYVWFSFENMEDLMDPQVCERVAKCYRHCRYVVISLGSNNKNIDLARRYAALLGMYSKDKTAIHYYMGEDAALNVRSTVSVDRIPRQITLHSFSLQEYAQDAAELSRNAFRVHYLYEKKDNPRASRKTAMEAFVKDRYSQKSSVATVLHIKYKLASVGIWPMPDQSERSQAISRYLQALTAQKNMLLELEHKRWMMFMIADGYSLPDMTTMESYSFESVDGTGFNRGFKCKSKRYHHCLVPCSNRGIVLRDLPRSEWDRFVSYEEIDATDYDPLDKMSLKVHLLAGHKIERSTKRKNILNIVDNIVAMIPPSCDELSAVSGEFSNWLKQSLENKMPTRIVERLQFLKNAFARYGIGIADWCKKLEDELSVYAEYNAYVDYKVPDETVIDNLLWLYYAEEDVGLIKLSADRVIDNITAPLLIEPRRVYYLGEVASETALRSFFSQHGNNTELCIVPCSQGDLKAIYEKLSEQVKIMESSAVIDVTGASELQIAAAMTFSAETNTPVICCDAATQTVVNVRGFEMAPAYRFCSSISAREVYELFGVAKLQIVDEDYVLRLNAHIHSLWEFYLEFQEKWDMISAFFAVYGKDTSEICIPSLRIDPSAQYRRYTSRMSTGKYNEIAAEAFFRHLEELEVIRDFTVRIQPRYVTVSFEYPAEGDDLLLEAINRLFVTDFGRIELIDRSRRIGENEYLIDLSSGLHVCADWSTFCDPRTNMQYSMTDMIDPLAKLDELELIALDERKLLQQVIEFDYAYDAVKECMAKAGNLLEAYVWCKAYETGYFDDVTAEFGFERGDSTAVWNELDVILTKGLSNIVISCIAEPPIQAHLYEIKCLADRFGTNTKPVVVSSLEATQAVCESAKELGVYLIDQKTIAEQGLGPALISVADDNYRWE